MKLALTIGYSGAQMALPVARVQRAETLGYDAVWTAEAYGSDALSPLAYLAAKTSRIKLGAGVIQLAARTAANAAMTAATIDALSGGRMLLGIGVSGPQIVEGWYGEPWGRPYYRLKDYVAIIRKIWAREAPVTHDGREISLPYQGADASGLAKPLRSILHMNPRIPIYLGTGNAASVRLTGEIADGWLPLGFVPETAHLYQDWINAGLAKAGKSEDQFERQAMTQVQVTDDVRSALDRLKPGIALYVGGMGHKNINFHKEMMIRRGFGDAAERIQELYLAKRKSEAIAAVPDDFVDSGALIGPRERIQARFKAWEDSGITGLTISGDTQAIKTMAEVARLNFAAES